MSIDEQASLGLGKSAVFAVREPSQTATIELEMQGVLTKEEILTIWEASEVLPAYTNGVAGFVRIASGTLW